jgi:hypothetical protein
MNLLLAIATAHVLTAQLHAGPFPFPSHGCDPWGYVTWSEQISTIRSEVSDSFQDHEQLERLLTAIDKAPHHLILKEVQAVIPHVVRQSKTRRLTELLRLRFRREYKGITSPEYLDTVNRNLLWSMRLASCVDGHINSFATTINVNKTPHGLEPFAGYTAEIKPDNLEQEWVRLICSILIRESARAREYANMLCIKKPDIEGLHLVRIQTWLTGNSTDAQPDSKKVTSMLNDAIKKWPNYPRLWYLYGWWNKGEVRKKYWAKYRAAKTGTFKFELERMKEFEKQN